MFQVTRLQQGNNQNCRQKPVKLSTRFVAETLIRATSSVTMVTMTLRHSYLFALSSFPAIPATASSEIDILCRGEVVSGHFDDLSVLNTGRVRRTTVLLQLGTSCGRNILCDDATTEVKVLLRSAEYDVSLTRQQSLF